VGGGGIEYVLGCRVCHNFLGGVKREMAVFFVSYVFLLFIAVICRE